MRARKRVSALSCAVFYLQICIFLSGADGIRTHALRRAKAKKYILVRTSVSGDFDVLQVFLDTPAAVRPPRTSMCHPGFSMSSARAGDEAVDVGQGCARWAQRLRRVSVPIGVGFSAHRGQRRHLSQPVRHSDSSSRQHEAQLSSNGGLLSLDLRRGPRSNPARGRTPLLSRERWSRPGASAGPIARSHLARGRR